MASTLAVPPWYLLLRAARRRRGAGAVVVPAEPYTAADLIEAILIAFHGFAPLPGATATPSTLATAFGEAMVERPAGSGKFRGSKIHTGESPAGAALPYVVMHATTLGEPEPVQGEHDAFQEAIRIDFNVYAVGPESDAIRLAKAVRRHFASRGGCPPLEWDGGRESARFPSAGEAEILPKQMGPDGQLIHGRRVTVEFRATFGESED